MKAEPVGCSAAAGRASVTPASAQSLSAMSAKASCPSFVRNPTFAPALRRRHRLVRPLAPGTEHEGLALDRLAHPRHPIRAVRGVGHEAPRMTTSCAMLLSLPCAPVAAPVPTGRRRMSRRAPAQPPSALAGPRGANIGNGMIDRPNRAWFDGSDECSKERDRNGDQRTGHRGRRMHDRAQRARCR
jgi:hypothetical protein